MDTGFCRYDNLWTFCETIKDYIKSKCGYPEGKIKYTDEPIEKVKIISDFLPSPGELALKDENVKVTIALSKGSLEFFKKEAKNIILNIRK